MQDQRRQRKVVDPVDPARNLDLALVVGMDLHQHLDAQRPCLVRELADEIECLRHHEATGAGLLDGIADGVQPDHADAIVGKGAQDAGQVGPALRVMHGNVDLRRREGGPEDAALAMLERGVGERQSRTGGSCSVAPPGKTASSVRNSPA